jgi:hypothetical protein
MAPWAEIPPPFGTNTSRRSPGRPAERPSESVWSRLPKSDFGRELRSEKDLPQDYDAAWETAGVNPALLDPVLLGGEFFPASAYAAAGVLYRDFFQKDRNGVSKGVLQIDLGSLP